MRHLVKIVVEKHDDGYVAYPLGIKGAGEAGTIPVGALLASAIEDALGVEITEMPLNPLRLFELTEDRRGGL